MRQQPSIGRVVHYTNLGSVDDDNKMVYPPTQQAALIVWTDGEAVDLLVFYRGGGQFPMSDVPYSDEYKRGHWSWPVRV